MAKSSFFFCLGVLLLFSIKRSAGIKCYSCISGCNDPFDATGQTTVDCTTSCSKFKAEASGVQVVYRSCADTAQTNGCIEGSSGGTTGSYCYCDTELCNGVEKQTATVTFIVALAISAYKLFV